MEIIRLNQKEMLDIKNNLTVMKNASCGLSSRLGVGHISRVQLCVTP